MRSAVSAVLVSGILISSILADLAPAPATAREAGSLEARPLSVVTTFSILGDLVARVGGARVVVRSLVGADGDVHVFKPTPKDAEALRRADMVVENGLGLEGWIDRLISASGYAGPRIVASDGITPRSIGQARLEAKNDLSGGHRHSEGHVHGAVDPHAWLDPRNAVRYAATIRDGLCKVDPAGCPDYETNTRSFQAELGQLHALLTTKLAAIPVDRRAVVTSHAALGYFADAYGLVAHAPIGASTESDPSAGDVGRLVRQLKGLGIAAVFVEHMTSARLMEQVARETGARLGGTLYLGALSAPEGPAASYVELMRYNGHTIAAALTR